MSTKTKEAAPKTNPANSLSEAIEAIRKLPQGAQYPNASQLLEAAAPGTPKRVGTQLRELKREAGEKVGRGGRYTGITPKDVVGLYDAKIKAKQATKVAAQATKDQAKVKAAAKKPAKAVKA